MKLIVENVNTSLFTIEMNLLLKNLLVKLIVDKYGYIIILLWWTFKSEWIISYIWIYGQNEIKLYILSSKYKIDVNVNPKIYKWFQTAV